MSAVSFFKINLPQPPMSQMPVHRHILLVSANAGTEVLVREALFLSTEIDDERKSSNGPPLLAGQPSFPQFILICLNNLSQVPEKIAEAQVSGYPFSLIFLEVGFWQWDLVQMVVEQMWECDPILRCVFFLSPDQELLPENISFSRPEQWAIHRFPVLSQDLYQLACCLSVRNPIPPGPGANKSGKPSAKQDASESNGNIDHRDSEETTGDLESTREALVASRYYVDNILRSMADSLLVINADMTIGAVNPSLLNLLNYEEHELIGMSPGLIFGEEFAQGAILEDLLLQGSVSGVESSFLTQEGRKIPISVSGSMMQNQQGQFQGLVCVAQDITERKRMEEEKLQLHEQLLDTSRKLGMAEVATGVLHNIGNILNSINVSIGVIIELLKNSMMEDVGRISRLLEKHKDDLAEYLSQNSKGKQIPGYLEKLSGQLLEERRIALLELGCLRENAGYAQHCVAAQQDLARPSGFKEPVSLAELFEEALTVNQDMLKNFSIDVIQQFQEVPQLIVDKHQVLQILVDLIRNACQAMESVVIKQLVVRVKLLIGPPDAICLEVQDSGKGIPQEDLTRIFGQGYSTKDGGRGLSLHQGALIAKNLGGSLRAQSEGEGKGAVFSLDLPGNFHFPEL
jgi:PAS domain S-box-containing protein